MQMSFNEIENILVTADWLASRDPRAKFNVQIPKREIEKRKISENVSIAEREQITELESARIGERIFMCMCALRFLADREPPIV